jgi:hypothetical protein
MGAIFFLRFICPRLTTIQQKSKRLSRSSITYDENARYVAKALILISNKVTPREEDALMQPISKDMDNLQRPIGYLLNKFADMPIVYSSDQTSVIKIAVCFYWLVMKQFYNCEDDCYSLGKLEYRLGKMEKRPFSDDDIIPGMGEILLITRFLEATRLDNISILASPRIK